MKAKAKQPLLHAGLWIYLVVTLFPFLWLVTTSLKPAKSVNSADFLGFFSPVLDNYRAIFTEGQFTDRLWNSIVISFATVLITVAVGSLAGYAIARMNIRKKENLFFFILTTRMAPPVAFGVPFFLLMTKVHLLDSRLGMIGVYVFMNLALCVWLTRGFFDEIPKEIEEAAYVDGCTTLTSFFRITLPLSIGGLITTAVLVFIMTWNEFFFASILTRNVAATYPVHLTTYFGSREIEWGKLAAASTVVSAIPIVFAILTRKYMVRGFSLGAVRNSK
ncbi:carbohydrate ABC transporter permease [Cohnella candidum]|uniref:Carbohydrate ABC transporter permease n=1 Tax=Cohnella candidum TaxID=2674991 RepID=A0A3G3K2Y9_9BACL|nr:carbohydrate ABC transporter permease [Cohnella candidum]AYQ74915.1 carbohydrate ABC transporter permease [Cohnella candidum]